MISRGKLESGGKKSYCLDCISCHKVGVMVFAPKPERKCFLIAEGLRYGVKSPSMESTSVAVSVPQKTLTEYSTGDALAAKSSTGVFSFNSHISPMGKRLSGLQQEETNFQAK